jgi:hypothetical protein
MTITSGLLTLTLPCHNYAFKMNIFSDGSDMGTSLKRGKFIGVVELIRHEPTIAAYHAAEAPLKLALIRKRHFRAIKEESPKTIALVNPVAAECRLEGFAHARESVSICKEN